MPKISLFKKYAKLAVKVGVNVKKNQRVVLRASTDAVELTREIALEAYKAGAKQVHVIWMDDYITKATYDYASIETLTSIPEWSVEQYQYYVDQGACFISVISPNPGIMKGVDPQKQGAALQASQQKLQFFSTHLMGNKVQWTIVAAPNEVWAHQLFPELKGKKAVEKLWDSIFAACRVTTKTNPIKEWASHNATLRAKTQLLNELNFKTLHFQNAKGTNLTVELVQDHLWAGGGEVGVNKVYFNPNIPTEEVFTMPAKFGTQGRVYSSKPLDYRGALIDEFYLDFKDGKVVGFDAKVGYDTLKSLLSFDENASYIGEVALISHDSPISNTNILFYNTLYDENASCHIALGRAYPMNIKNGNHTPIEELVKKGYNHSLIHVDFMFGTSDMTITGTKYDGTKVIVFNNGNFAI